MAESFASLIPPLVTFVCLLGLSLSLYQWTRRQDTNKVLPAQVPYDSLRPTAHPIAVIIPVLNEAVVLPTTIARLFSTCSLPTTLGCPAPTVLVVDGGSGDGSEASLAPVIASHPSVRFVPYPSSPSRGGQQTFGAQQSSAPILLFLHADTLLPRGWDATILSTLSAASPPAVGAFTLSLPSPIPFSLRVMLHGANMRARYGGLPYGDQAYFLCRTTFDAVGGFPNVPIMEDVELLRLIRRRVDGRMVILEDRVETSPRRWIKNGVVWNTVLNQLLVLAWLCGVPPSTIYTWYYGRPPTSSSSK